MKHTVEIYIFSLFNFFCLLQSMDTPNHNILSDKDLQSVITRVNSSGLNIVNIIKKTAEENTYPLTAMGIRSLLQLTQEQVNNVFLSSVDKDSQVFEIMLAMGAHINTQAADGRNCLFYTSDQKRLNELISQGANIHCQDKNNTTPLYYHCRWNLNKDLIRVFLQAGADPDESQDHDPLLVAAIKKNDVESVKLFCNYKADVNRDLGGYYKNPLILALKHDTKINYQIVETLLESGAIADCHDTFHDDDGYYRYPLHHVTGFPNLTTFNPELAILLLKYKANPNRPYPFSQGKNFPLHQAITLKHVALIKALLEHSAQTDCLNLEKLTPLALAKVTKCSDNIITLLSEHTSATSAEYNSFVEFLIDITPPTPISNNQNPQTIDYKPCIIQ